MCATSVFYAFMNVCEIINRAALWGVPRAIHVGIDLSSVQRGTLRQRFTCIVNQALVRPSGHYRGG